MPQGRLKLKVVGQAFGPNVELPFRVIIGEKEITLRFSAKSTEVIHHVVNDSKCADNVTFDIPKPTTPQDLGLSSDTRKLGLGLIEFEITKD